MEAKQSRPSVAISASRSDRQVVSNLLQLYLYDMASMNFFPVEPNGQYAYDFLDRFWEHPYLLYENEALAGFALVTSRCFITQKSPCWFMAEFFVLRPHRRKNLGRRAVREILARHPGNWHVANMVQNVAADAFWSKSLTRDVSERGVRFDGSDWMLRAFRSERISVISKHNHSN